jgi:hypothetical protein
MYELNGGGNEYPEWEDVYRNVSYQEIPDPDVTICADYAHEDEVEYDSGNETVGQEWPASEEESVDYTPVEDISDFDLELDELLSEQDTYEYKEPLPEDDTPSEVLADIAREGNWVTKDTELPEDTERVTTETTDTLVNRGYPDTELVEEALTIVQEGSVGGEGWVDRTKIDSEDIRQGEVIVRHHYVDSESKFFAKVTELHPDDIDYREGLTELQMAPLVAEAVETPEVRAVLDEFGVDSLTVVAPLVVSRDLTTGTETLLYEWQDCTPLNVMIETMAKQIGFKAYETGMAEFAYRLGGAFTSLGIDPVDIDTNQVGIRRNPDFTVQAFLFDMEFYRRR